MEFAGLFIDIYLYILLYVCVFGVFGDDVNKSCDKKTLDNLEQAFGNLCVVHTSNKANNYDMGRGLFTKILNDMRG